MLSAFKIEKSFFDNYGIVTIINTDADAIWLKPDIERLIKRKLIPEQY